MSDTTDDLLVELADALAACSFALAKLAAATAEFTPENARALDMAAAVLAKMDGRVA